MYQNLFCGTLICPLSIGQHNLKLKCISDIIQFLNELHNKLDCYALHTSTTRKNSFSKTVFFLGVLHDQTSVESLLIQHNHNSTLNESNFTIARQTWCPRCTRRSIRRRLKLRGSSNTTEYIWYSSLFMNLFSSPEHKVLRVSYCDRSLSVVCRRPLSVNIFT